MTTAAPLPRARRMFPRKDAAYYLGISLRSLDDLKASGDVRATLLAGRVVYDIADLDSYIERAKRSA